MSYKYITFDEYYDVREYNSFLTACKNNSIQYQEYINIKPPHYRYLKLDKDNLPVFLNYDIADAGIVKFLVSVVKPSYPNEKYLLTRRPGKDISYWEYILPEDMKTAHKKDYFIMFKSNSFNELQEISKKLGKVKIFKLGRSKLRKNNLYYCYNPYIKGFLNFDNIVLEYGKEAKNSTAIHSNKKVPNTPGQIEVNLNYYYLVKEKLEDKHYLAEFWYNGLVNPLKKETFI
jgi:hypothetical protein